jgi:hypothetical protein
MDRGEVGSGAVSAGGSDRPKQLRRVFGDDGEEGSGSGSDDGDDTPTEDTEKEITLWKLATTGNSGKLPGVYQRYCLIRPAPSLRIIFVSPALRKNSNIGQKPFLSHLAAPSATLSGLKESFTSGTPVTAKVAFMAEPGSNRDGTPTARWRRTNSKSKDEENEKNEKDPSTFGRPCWISATPLMGGDEQVGVWMVIFVDKSIAPGRTLSKTKGEGMKHQQLEGRALGIVKAEDRNGQIQALSDDIKKDDMPIKPVRVGGTSMNGTPRKAQSLSPPGDREAAREMYDKNGNEAVQQEASKTPPESPNDQSVENATTLNNNANETEPRNNSQAEDSANFDGVPKANSADDEDSGPGPAEEEDDEHYTACDEIPSSPRELIAAQQSGIASQQHGNSEDGNESETFVRRHSHSHSQPLTPNNAKGRVVIWSGSSSDGEKEGKAEADIDSAALNSFPGKHDPAEEDSTPRAKHEHTDTHTYTHAHNQSDEGYEEGEGSRPEISTSGAPLYMDYLRHPGTREQMRKASGGGTASDPDCEVWSPYSVD